MILNNFKLLLIPHFGTDLTKPTNINGSTINAKLYLNNNANRSSGDTVIYNTVYSNAATSTSSSYTGLNTYLLGFGTGTTPATANDYNLEAVIPNTSNLTYSITKSIHFYYHYLQFTVAITNNTSEDVNISEIGLFAGQGSTGTYNITMLTRDVLNNPIIIPAGVAKSIVYRLNFDTIDTTTQAY